MTRSRWVEPVVMVECGWGKVGCGDLIHRQGHPLGEEDSQHDYGS